MPSTNDQERLGKTKLKEYDLFREFRLPLMGLLEITCPSSSTDCNERSSAFSSVPNRTLPDTESRSVAGHRAHSFLSLTPPFMDQKVVLRVASLTRTLSVDTLFRDRAHRLLHVSSLLLECSRLRLASGNQLAKRNQSIALHDLLREYVCDR